MNHHFRSALAAGLLMIAIAGAAGAQTPDYDAGLGAYASGDYASALAHWRPLAEQGNAEAQYGLAEMYDQGRGVAENADTAADWYQRAAEQGYARAQAKLGTMFATGHGVPVDPTTAAVWWRKAAEQGSAAAQMRLAEAFHKGEGVERDLDQASAWYERAARAGVSAARVGLFEVGQEREREARAAADAIVVETNSVVEQTGANAITAEAVAPDEVAGATEQGREHATVAQGSDAAPGDIAALRPPLPDGHELAGAAEPAATSDAAPPTRTDVPTLARLHDGDALEGPRDDPLAMMVAAGTAVVLPLDAARLAAAADTADVEPLNVANDETTNDEWMDDVAAPDSGAASEAQASLEPVTDAAPKEFRIWLVSLHDEAAAKSAWSLLSQRHGDVLGKLEPFIEPAVAVDGGTLYRVQAGPFDSALAAQEACATLGARSTYCVAIAP